MGDKVDTKARRKALLACLKKAEGALTGSYLSELFNVSRQIIVGDIGVLRAEGNTIYATPRGYVLPAKESDRKLTLALPCRHQDGQLKEELEIIVDNGGFIRDVIVEHPLYGELKADLLLGSRHDVDEFYCNMQKKRGIPLSVVTGGIHWHTVEVSTQAAGERIKDRLREKGILVDN